MKTDNALIKIFDFVGRQVRVVKQPDGTDWYVANGVCRVLGYKMMANGHPNVTQALQPLDRDEKCLYKIKTPHSAYKFRIISRSGLNKLISHWRSCGPAARRSTSRSPKSFSR